MITKELVAKLELKVICEGEERIIETGYCGDLLSWVMGRAPQNSAWITIMSNVNVAAVAVLSDVSCIILAEDVKPDEQLLERATKEKLYILSSSDDMYTLALKLGEALK